MLYSTEISPIRCNNCVFILRNGFTLHVSVNLTHHQEYICCIWPQVSRLTYVVSLLLDVSVVNSPVFMELLVITVLFCVVLPAGNTTQNKAVITNNCTTIGLFTTDTSNKKLTT